MSQRAYFLLLFLFLTAPDISGLVLGQNANPLLRSQGSGTSVSRGEAARENFYLTKPTDIKLSEVWEPMRSIIGLFFLAFLMRIIVKKQSIIPLDRTEQCMGIFALILIGNVVAQSNRIAFGLRVASDAFIVPFLAYFIMRRLVINEHRFRQFIRILAYLSCYLIVLGLIDFLTHPLFRYRVAGPFRHRDLLYIIVMVTFFMVLLNFLSTRNLLRQRQDLPGGVTWFVLIFAPFVIFLTLTRGNWLGFAFGGWVLLFFGRKLIGFQQKIIWVGLVLLLVPIVLAGVVASMPEEIVNRTHQENTFQARLLAWEIAINEGLKDPVFGIGLNNLRDVLGTISIRSGGARSLSTSHNCFLALFVELGAVGLLAYLAMAVSIVHTGLKLYGRRAGPREQWYGVILIAMMVAYLMPAFFSTILYVPAVSHVYVFAAAGAIAGLFRSCLQRHTSYTIIPERQQIPSFY
jgi:O-antigen ligase